MQKVLDYDHLFIKSKTAPLEKGVVFSRLNNGTFATNVPYVYTTGGLSTGFETGHAGYGPSELALNLVPWFLDAYAEPCETTVPILNGKIRSDAWTSRHEFKDECIQYMKLETGDGFIMPVELVYFILDGACQKTSTDVIWKYEPDEEKIRIAVKKFVNRFLKG